MILFSLEGDVFAQQIFQTWQTQIVNITEIISRTKNEKKILDYKVEASVILMILEDQENLKRYCSIIFFIDNIIDNNKFRYYELFEVPPEVESIELHQNVNTLRHQIYIIDNTYSVKQKELYIEDNDLYFSLTDIEMPLPECHGLYNRTNIQISQFFFVQTCTSIYDTMIYFTSSLTFETFFEHKLRSTEVELHLVDQGLTPSYIALFQNSDQYRHTLHSWLLSFQNITTTQVYIKIGDFDNFESWEVLTNQNKTRAGAFRHWTIESAPEFHLRVQGLFGKMTPEQKQHYRLATGGMYQWFAENPQWFFIYDSRDQTIVWQWATCLFITNYVFDSCNLNRYAELLLDTQTDVQEWDQESIKRQTRSRYSFSKCSEMILSCQLFKGDLGTSLYHFKVLNSRFCQKLVFICEDYDMDKLTTLIYLIVIISAFFILLISAVILKCYLSSNDYEYYHHRMR